VALEAGIGVDIERARPRDSMLAIAEYLGWRSKTRNIRDFYMTWTLWEASAKCIEGSVLMTKNPGFEALCDVETQAQTVNSERWCGLSDDVEGDLFYSIVLQCQQNIPMTHRTLEPGKVVPW
jgi:phosphopantetheinyl transferase